MEIYRLPDTTIVNRNIPKNAFEQYANSKQKKGFTDLISKITWKNKISEETVNLTGNDIQEIQVFEVQLKQKAGINGLLDLIDKSIPYHIIFVIVIGDELMFRTAKKHAHPTNEDNSIIDWVFESNWKKIGQSTKKIILKKSIDFIYKEFCSSISEEQIKFSSINKMIEYQAQVKELKTTIEKLESKIKKGKQFNKKLEMNVELNALKNKLELILSNN